jgi:multidrug efflux system outer membrane protein
MNWEIDIWGKIKSQNEAAYNEYIADIDNRNALIVSLVSQVAELYFILRDLDNRLVIAQQTYSSRVGSTKIITDRYEKGWVAEVDKLQAQLQEYQAQAVIPQLQREIVITQNAIRVLMGLGPGPLPRGNDLYSQKIQTNIPTGLPSQLLQRRPDIHSAEKTLEAQFNRIGVAKANLYPVISLTGILGFASPQLSTLISSGGFVANGFAGLVGPLFNFNRNKRYVRVQEYNTLVVAKQYEQTVLNAFGEVDNALAQYRTLVDEHNIRVNEVAVAQKALELVRAKYDYGFTSYYEVLTQENYLFDAQLQESFTYQLQLNALVSLYKALGGGWNQ